MTILGFIFIASIVVYFILFQFDNAIFGRDKFTPGKVIIYFGVLPTLSIFTLSLGMDKVDLYVFQRISPTYHELSYLYLAALVPMMSVTFAYIGSAFSQKTQLFKSFLYTVYKPFLKEIKSKTLRNVGFFCYTVGFVIFLILLIKIGGIAAFWGDVNSRVENLGGLGYLNKGYVFLLIFSCNLICLYYFKQSKTILAIFYVLLSCIFLSILGSRSTSLSLIVTVIVSYNFYVKPIKNIFSVTNIFVAVFMLIVILGIVNLRENGAIDKYINSPVSLIKDMDESFEKHLLMRFSRIERDIIIFNYFNEHQLWYGNSYLSLLTAPIPRSIFKDKPPIDIGMYLVKISQNEILNYPEPNDSLPNYSWPTGNSEAFMNFHFPGLIICYFLSGFIFSQIYKLIYISNYHPYIITLYGMFCFGGAVDLSTMGIVNLLTRLVFFYFVLILSSILYLRFKR
ncbi:oligosaccharide repeat unit polymerase [Vibrio vulnificus]|uniref:O-antigen polymerase n=1 Tax=Vibrio vulnificus TaxID=672 RepID=UPI00215C398B|nr:O-antigen polymerase [Vibrio vulnificus]MCR9703238.1 oligosaccharide repeat unit polymerase [Vibrio vulnificus]